MRVFISSTNEDLKDYRDAAKDAAIGADFVPDMQEYWEAGGRPPLGKCIERVEGSDVVVVIIAHRYGWTPDEQTAGERKSITWLECEAAVKAGKEVLAFLVDENHRWDETLKESYQATVAIEKGKFTPELMQTIQNSVQGLRDFKAWLNANVTRELFTTPDDLRGRVQWALNRWRERHGRAAAGDSVAGARVEAAPRQKTIGPRPEGGEGFYDRSEQLAQLRDLLDQGDRRFICITGRGGIGKTALLSRICMEIEDEQNSALDADGIVYVRCRESDRMLIEKLYHDFGEILGAPHSSDLERASEELRNSLEEKVRFLLEKLRNGRYRLVLDNLDSLLNDEHKLQDDSLQMLIDCCTTTPSGLQIIATSRQLVSVDKTGLRSVRVVTLEAGLPESDGIALLRDFDATGKLNDESPTLLAETVRRCDGQPAALVSIARLLFDDPTLQLGHLLENEDLFNEEVVNNLIAEHYKRLEIQQQTVLQALAVFDKPASAEQVQFFTSRFAADLNVRLALRSLCQNHFVKHVAGKNVYELHPLDQQYVYKQLSRSDNGLSRQAAHAAAADWCVSQKTEPSNWKSLNDVQPHLDEFNHRVRADQFDEAARVLNEIDLEHLQNWGHFRLVIGLRNQLAGKLIDPVLQRLNVGNLGVAHHWIGKDDKALPQLKEALDEKRWSGAASQRPDIHLPNGTWMALVARSLLRLGRTNEAIDLANEALQMPNISPREQCLLLNVLGIAHKRLGDLAKADEYYKQALSVAGKIPDRYLESQLRNNRGLALVAAGSLKDAIEELQTALEVSRKIRARLVEACVLESLADAYRRDGQFDLAGDFYAQSNQKSKEVDNQSNLAHSLEGSGTILHLRGELVEASGFYLEAHNLSATESLFRIALKLGILCAESNDQAGAERYLKQSRSLCRGLIQAAARNYEAWYCLAHNELASGEASALDTYRKAMEICSEPGVLMAVLLELDLVKRICPDSKLYESAHSLLAADGPSE